jgi:hypothetical protein
MVGEDRVVAHDLLVPGGQRALEFVVNAKRA